jgi:hypothetical protein
MSRYEGQHPRALAAFKHIDRFINRIRGCLTVGESLAYVARCSSRVIDFGGRVVTSKRAAVAMVSPSRALAFPGDCGGRPGKAAATLAHEPKMAHGR